MSINSLSFLLFLSVALAVFHLGPSSWRSRVVFPVSSLVFLILVMPSLSSVSVVVGFCALIWLLSLLISKYPGRGAIIAVLGFILIVFGWLKEYDFLSFLPFSALIPATIGLSYILIRALQLLIDLREEPALKPGALSTFSFLLAWPCLISGPIQRYQDFESQLAGMAAFRLNDDIWRKSLRRMIRGWFWVLVVSDICEHVWQGLMASAFQAPFPLALGGAELFFFLHLFFDFAGYTEIVIGAGQLFGLQLPENFNRPFRARSFLDFWSRWHMSMSNWLKAYVFNPLLMALTKRWPSSKASNYLAAIAFFVTFFLIGLWHGTTTAYVVCGLLLGLGASVNQWYRTIVRKSLGKSRFNTLGANPFYRVLCTGITFAYICFSISPLWLSLEEMKILTGYGWKGLALAHLWIFVLSMVFFSLSLPLPRSEGGRWKDYVVMAFQCVLIEVYLFLYPSFGGDFFYEQF
jgi:alginate O-acetyltransferase complex protein AlgI